MPTSSGSDAKLVIHFTTSQGGSCPHCGFGVLGLERFADSVNHLIKDHAYKLLHIGQETHHADDGSPWHTTAAVLGYMG